MVRGLFRCQPTTAFFLPSMLRRLIQPRLWWWLSVPFLFVQTRGFYLSTPATRTSYHLFNNGGAHIVQPWGYIAPYRRMLPYFINHYGAFGLNFSPQTYALVEDTMQALVWVVVAIYAQRYLWPRLLRWNP